MKRELRIYLMLCLVALIPAAFVYVGRPGDDILFHMSSWVEMLEGWRAGVGWPAWASHANFNLGEPRFYFYPPLSRLLGAALLLVLPVKLVPGAFVWALLTLAGVATFELSADVLPVRDRPVAAVLGVTGYYLNALVLIRFAVAELMTAALLPLILLAYLRLLAGLRRRATLQSCARETGLLAILLALTWLSDAPAAVAIAYLMLGTTVVEAALQRDLRPLGALLIADAAALGLSAWYLLPAMLARHQIGATQLLRVTLINFMLFHAPPRDFAAAMKYPLWSWVVLAVAVAIVAARRDRVSVTMVTTEPKLPLRPLAVIAVIAVVCQLPLSLPLWSMLPEFGFIQIPFRFDIVLGSLLPVVALRLFPSRGSRLCLYVLWLLFFMIPLAAKVAQQRYHPEGLRLAYVVQEIPAGYAGYAEYGTAGVNGLADPGAPREKVVGIGADAAACAAAVGTWKPELRLITTASAKPCSYRLALNFYPDWRAWLDGEVTTLSPLNDGLTRVDVPAGMHTLVLKFVRPRGPAYAGAAVSCMACCLIGVALYSDRRTTRSAVATHL